MKIKSIIFGISSSVYAVNLESRGLPLCAEESAWFGKNQGIVTDGIGTDKILIK